MANPRHVGQAPLLGSAVAVVLGRRSRSPLQVCTAWGAIDSRSRKSVGGTQQVSRVTPLFSLYNSTAHNHFYTTVPQMARRLEKAGFRIEALLGDYRGGPWDERAEAWLLIASRDR